MVTSDDLAAADLQDEARCHIDAPDFRLRVEPALVAIARVGQDAELAAGASP